MESVRTQETLNRNTRGSLTMRHFQFLGLVLLTLGVQCNAATNSAPSAHQAVENGLQFLQKEAFRWKTTRSCAACHHAAMVLWTFNEARAHGYSIDEQAFNDISLWAFGDMKTNSLTPQAPSRDVINLGWVYVLLSMETAPAFASLSSHKQEQPITQRSGATNDEAIFSARQTLIQQIVAKQDADGSWGKPLDERVPLGGPAEDIALLSQLALLQSGDDSSAITSCLDKAATWLAAKQDKTSRQGRNFRLLIHVCEKKSSESLNPIMASIRGEQNTDGGWSQTPEMGSDAYATGQTLYVLARAGVKPEASEMKRGVENLTRTQREDGSWPMISRVNAKNLTPITAAGTAWAVLGLLRASQ